MGDWPQKTIRDLVELQRGFDLTDAERRPGSVPVMGAAGANGFHDEARASAPGIVLGRSGGSYGQVHFADRDFWPHNTAMFVTNYKGNDPHFAYYFLKNLDLKSLNSGSAQPSLNRNYVYPLKVCFPDPGEQKEIAAALFVLDAKIDLNNRINAELDALAKTIYDYWFVQFDFPDAEGRPYKSSGGKMVWNDALKREIPAGWEVGPLGNWLRFQRGISYRAAEIGDEGTPLINLNSFRLDGSVKLDGTKRYCGKFRDDQRVCPGDLVIAVTDVTRNADITGRAFVVPDLFGENPLISCDVAAVRGRPHMSAHYLERLFNSEHYHNYLKPFAAGTLVLHLNLDGVRWFEAFLPPKSLLEKFDVIATATRRQVNANLAQNIELTRLRDWLLPLLMNGQVRVA